MYINFNNHNKLWYVKKRTKIQTIRRESILYIEIRYTFLQIHITIKTFNIKNYKQI